MSDFNFEPDYSDWSTEKLKRELLNARDDLRDDNNYLNSLPSAARDYSILEDNRRYIERLEAELNKRGWR